MSAAVITYSDDQLVAIRRVIAELPKLTPEEVGSRDTAVADGRCPEHLWPLWPLAKEDAGLWETLSDDRKIPEFSVYGLFPAAYGPVYGGEFDSPTVRYDGRARGRVAIVSGRRAGATVGVVIKPAQSPAEAQIAGIAGAASVGPIQLPSIAGFISEEWVAGEFLTDLNPGEVMPERMQAIGRELGTMLNRLHAAGVCYNDATIADPEGRSHIIVEPDGRMRLIDFGVALLLRDHPAGLTFHDAYNAARTDPMFRLFRRMTPAGDHAALARFVADYGRRLAGLSVAEIQERDWRIADEGAALVSGCFGPECASALREGLSIARCRR